MVPWLHLTLSTADARTCTCLATIVAMLAYRAALGCSCTRDGKSKGALKSQAAAAGRSAESQSVSVAGIAILK